MSDRIVVFAGTSEGYEVARFLAGKGLLDRADFCVATEYGESTFEDLPETHIISGRLSEPAMEELFRKEGYAMVVDATHPYAAVVTSYLKEAAENCGIPYLRLLREEEEYDPEGVIFVDSPEEAAAVLSGRREGFLLTTGAKDLPVYSEVTGFSQRAVARVLPSVSSIEACLAAGVQTRNIIGMQGPFTREMNRATMEQYGLRILVTKSTGKAGGFMDKVSLARDGYIVIVIGRPLEEKGCSLEEGKERIIQLWK